MLKTTCFTLCLLIYQGSCIACNLSGSCRNIYVYIQLRLLFFFIHTLCVGVGTSMCMHVRLVCVSVCRAGARVSVCVSTILVDECSVRIPLVCEYRVIIGDFGLRIILVGVMEENVRINALGYWELDTRSVDLANQV